MIEPDPQAHARGYYHAARYAGFCNFTKLIYYR